MVPILIRFAGWLTGHLYQITTAVFGAYSAYRVWDDRRPKVAFRIVLEESMPLVRVFNLGKVPIILEELQCVRYDPDDGPFSSSLNRQLNPGADNVDLDLPADLLSEIVLAADLEAKIRYRSPSGKSRWTSTQAFNLVGSGRRFVLRQLFGRTRDVTCPKCGTSALVDVTGLKNQREVATRCKEFERELRRLCPVHDPILMLREQRRRPAGK